MHIIPDSWIAQNELETLVESNSLYESFTFFFFSNSGKKF